MEFSFPISGPVVTVILRKLVTLEFSRVFVSFEKRCSRFRPLKLWRTCGATWDTAQTSNQAVMSALPSPE